MISQKNRAKLRGFLHREMTPRETTQAALAALDLLASLELAEAGLAVALQAVRRFADSDEVSGKGRRELRELQKTLRGYLAASRGDAVDREPLEAA